MVISKIERQLLWYKSSKSDPEQHFWNFLIINENREFNGIRQKLYDSLKSIIEENMMDYGKIENSNLHYGLFCLVSPTSNIDFSKVYKGYVAKDRRLQSRKTRDGWNEFINQVQRGEI